MIQRIQSIFIFISLAACASLFILPFAESNKVATPLFEDKLFNIMDNPVLIVLASIGALLAVVDLLMFKNRPLQLRLGYIITIISVFLAVVAFWLMYSKASQLPEIIIEDKFGLYMPVISLISILLANRFIKKDEDLVSNMDRLR